MYLLDSTILIDILRGNESAIEYISQNLYTNFATSVIVLMELIQGTKTKADIKSIYSLLRDLNLEVFHVSTLVSEHALSVYESNYHKKQLGWADAFIAATCIQNNLELVTLNMKHFNGVMALKTLKPY